MLIAVIQVKDYKTAREQIHLAINQADGVELRLDYAEHIDFDAIARLRSEFNLPMIFTLRKKSQGGFYPHNEEQRLNDILTLCQLNPDYFDIEYDVSHDFLKKIYSLHSRVKFICSYHNFTKTPTDLTTTLQFMQHPSFYAYKIATYANKISDALRMLEFINITHKKKRITGICMGTEGQCTRILNPIVGNAMNYVSLSDVLAIAPGQISLNELVTTYHLRKLNTASQIYALLGNPIDLSVGHLLHNQAIELLGNNAVYIKLRITPDDLPEVIKLCRNLPFAGFSITMPLKECIIPLLDKIESATQPIHAINSIAVVDKKYKGFNTDGIGAMQALSAKMDLAKQTIVILGAGGAARAIAFAALKNKAKVIILNRTFSKAKKLGDELGCEYDVLSHLKKIHYTVLVNTLPNTVYSEQHDAALEIINQLRPQTVAMDIVYQPIVTTFLEHAKKAGGICIFGYEMYVYQAIQQINHWFKPTQNQLDDIQNNMMDYFKEKALLKN